MHEDINLYYWAQNFQVTRTFGWGIPHVSMVPLADMFNHREGRLTIVDVFHSKLHLANNKIYMHKFDFDTIIRDPKGSNEQDEEFKNDIGEE